MVLVQGISCSTQEDTLVKVFDNKQLGTVYKIIEFYDSFVLSKTNKKISIDKAYIDFLNTNCPKVIEFGDLGILMPKRNEEVNFYKTLDRKDLSEFYIIQDTLKLIDRKINKTVKKYYPYYFTLNTKGKYIKLLKLLALKNDFYKEYLKTIEFMSDLSPGSYAMILMDYKKMDFKKKEERLVLIINLLHSQETLMEYENEP